MTRLALRDLPWATMPADGGQIVEVSYAEASDCDEYYRRVIDRSDQSVTMDKADLSEVGEFEWDPPNGIMTLPEAAWERVRGGRLGRYTADVREDGGGSDTFALRALNPDDALEEALTAAEAWCREGDWGDEGASVRVRAEVYDSHGDLVETDSVTVDIDPDEEALAAAVAETPDCEHTWTADAATDGGLEENPGVFGHGGTTISVTEHCARCGLQRTWTRYGSQRNPGQADRVAFNQLEVWPEHVSLDEVRALGTECGEQVVEAAHGNVTDDETGESLLPSEPLPGDWDALRELLLEREPTDEEREAFMRAYTDAVAEA